MAKTATGRDCKGKCHCCECENVWSVMKQMGGIVTSWRKHAGRWRKQSQKWHETYMHYGVTVIEICIYLSLYVNRFLHWFLHTDIWDVSTLSHNIKAKSLISISVVICCILFDLAAVKLLKIYILFIIRKVLCQSIWKIRWQIAYLAVRVTCHHSNAYLRYRPSDVVFPIRKQDIEN